MYQNASILHVYMYEQAEAELMTVITFNHFTLLAEILMKQALHFSDLEFLDIALGIRWSMMAGTMEA